MLYNNYWIVADCETGGFSAEKNPMTEVGIVILDSNLNVVKEYESLIKPYGDKFIQKEVLEVTGLTLQEINTGKDVKQVVTELIDLIKPFKVGKFMKPIFVGHNFEEFDIKFFESIFSFCKKDVFEVVSKHIEDTMWLSRMKWGIDGESTDFKLPTCCHRAGVEIVQAHRALVDTRSTAKLFTYLMNSLRNKNVGGKVEEKKIRDSFKF